MERVEGLRPITTMRKHSRQEGVVSIGERLREQGRWLRCLEMGEGGKGGGENRVALKDMSCQITQPVQPSSY